MPRRLAQHPAGVTSTAAAHLVRQLGRMADLPWPEAVGEVEADDGRLHSADITAGFWGRMREARLALTAGSVLRAERVLRPRRSCRDCRGTSG